MDKGQSVKVAVRIRPLQDGDLELDSNICIGAIRRANQIVAGSDTVFTFDNVFDHNTQQTQIYDECVGELVNATFEGFNATILAYGQTGSGKTWTMGSASDATVCEDNYGIIPRVINNLFHMIVEKEELDECSTYKVHVQFLEIYGEEVRDLLDQTKTAKVSIRETADGELFISGAKEEFVGSFEQMMKTLEDGTKNRSTAATKMNATSSRSHAIFTVFLEHTLHVAESAVIGSTGSSRQVGGGEVTAAKKEVRKSKFHFVDLAGSERAKRTGAEGKQLKEGININQGLLALGNVISALGDEKKRGKVFVPYRDSKLTRMLQDSLGGNSKTLMICCVSPALSNLTESINALRYANRARNIQNKPVVNRDPTLVVIDGLKKLLKVVAMELYDIRVSGKIVEVDNGVSNELLSVLSTQTMANSDVPLLVDDMDRGGNSGGNNSTGTKGGAGGGIGAMFAGRVEGDETAGPPRSIISSTKMGSASGTGTKVDRNTLNNLNRVTHDLELLQGRLKDADFEVRRLGEKLKAAKNKDSADHEQLLLLTSERDFYKMKWTDASPEESNQFESGGSGGAPDAEKLAAMGVTRGYLREIDELKRRLAEAENSNRQQREELEASSFTAPSDEEYTTSIAMLIEQTKQQLHIEKKRLGNAANGIAAYGEDADSDRSVSPNADEGDLSDDEDKVVKHSVEHLKEVEDQEREFTRRTHVMESEVTELGQSILMKEQLVAQLARSQHQYSAMKEFYEKKLATLTGEVKDKQEERNSLLIELTALQSSKRTEDSGREEQLKKSLAKKDDELKLLKESQDKLRNLTQVQSRYTSQVGKLEADILGMKKARVDLSRSLQAEKRNHLQMLDNKAKEISKLKKELTKASLEMKKLGHSKEVAETRMRDALRKNQSQGAIVVSSSSSSSKLPPTFESGKLGMGAGGVGGVARDEAAVLRENMRYVNKMTRSGSSNQLYSQNELQTKKWLSKCIADISTREAAADSLKREYESQLALLKQKTALESDRNSLHTRNHANSKDDSQEVDGTAASIGIAAGGKSHRVLPAEDAVMMVLTAAEEKKLIEIENSLANIDSQLGQRAKQIDSIQLQLESLVDVGCTDERDLFVSDADGRASPSDMLPLSSGDSFKGGGGGSSKFRANSNAGNNTLEVLKKTAAGSLPAAHELIRLLFDMLVGSQKTSRAYQLQIRELTEKLKTMKREVDDGVTKLQAQKRAHDQELTRREADYEEKLFGVFQHMTAEDINWNGETESPRQQEHASLAAASSITNPISSLSSIPAGQNHTVISVDEYKFLKEKIQKEAMQLIEMQFRIDDVEESRSALLDEIEEKAIQIKFLEDDRAIFKEMVDDLKSGLQQFGKPGKLVLDALKEESQTRRKSVINMNNYAALSSTTFDDIISDSDDDSLGDGLTDAFEFLADEINRTGTAVASAMPFPAPTTTSGEGVGALSMIGGAAPPLLTSMGTIATPGRPHRSNSDAGAPARSARSNSDIVPPGPSAAASSALNAVATAANGSGAKTKPVVYDRLTNPTYFTGHMKKVFDTEVETKRKKVLETRTVEKAVSHNHGVSAAAAIGSSSVSAAVAAAISGGVPTPIILSNYSATGGSNSAPPSLSSFESMGMRKAASVALSSPRNPVFAFSTSDDYAIPSSAVTAALSGAVAAGPPSHSDVSKNVFARLTGGNKTSVASLATGKTSRPSSVDPRRGENSSPATTIDPAPPKEHFKKEEKERGEQKTEKVSVYAKKTENFLAAVNTKVGFAPVVATDAVDTGGTSGVTAKSRIKVNSSPVFEEESDNTSSGATINTTSAGQTPNPNARRSSTGSLAYSTGSSANKNISHDDADDYYSDGSEESYKSPPPTTEAVAVADGENGEKISSGARRHSMSNPDSLHRWSTAGTGKWHRMNPSSENGSDGGASHLQHLQDELQRAVSDLGALVGAESSSNSNSVTATPDKKNSKVSKTESVASSSISQCSSVEDIINEISSKRLLSLKDMNEND